MDAYTAPCARFARPCRMRCASGVSSAWPKAKFTVAASGSWRLTGGGGGGGRIRAGGGAGGAAGTPHWNTMTRSLGSPSALLFSGAIACSTFTGSPAHILLAAGLLVDALACPSAHSHYV